MGVAQRKVRVHDAFSTTKGAVMEHELWAELSAAISLIDPRFVDNPDFEHSTATIVRCHCWSVLHERATSWACNRKHWVKQTCPQSLPSQPTMSRRLRSAEFEQFMTLLEQRLGHLPRAGRLFKRMDGRPLQIAAHSSDRDAGWGRGAGQKAKGYKLHAIWAGRAMPLQWRVAPLDKSEQKMARRMLLNLSDPGYVSADKNYDSNELFDVAASRENQLICPRRYGPDKGLGHVYQSAHRLRCKDLLEGPTRRLTRFGPQLMKQRSQIERDFGNDASAGCGLHGLPPWVRRYGRVRRWVWTKLLINAARIRVNQRRKCRSDE
jgi:hypothetical protein